ncbi:DUF3035 domain-containing protein [Mesobacterium pallidum]|uniref:DUF3035 domain-containing protein n=1 Tax=Mesobacterium pallidum TaxID=2872037 RepID=UPI001EE31A0F|nr:DUF3035 domain-containing protein [Mesobacterium pallidum]
MIRLITLLALCTALVACGERDISMRNLNIPTDNGPEEFAVLPVKPLEMPESFAALPAPTPGSGNLVDPTPNADAIVALGGRPSASSGIPAGDSALVSQASRYGVPADIRRTLASEDLAFRKRASRFTNFRLGRVDRYVKAYRRQSLDAHAETERFRRLGTYVPSAPPTSGRESGRTIPGSLSRQ